MKKPVIGEFLVPRRRSIAGPIIIAAFALLVYAVTADGGELPGVEHRSGGIVDANGNPHDTERDGVGSGGGDKGWFDRFLDWGREPIGKDRLSTGATRSDNRRRGGANGHERSS